MLYKEVIMFQTGRREQSNGTKAVAFSDFAIFFAVCWIVVALFSSLLFRVHWFVPGDFNYSAAMYYHGIMVPVLILLYLLTQKIFPLEVVNERVYTAGAISAILLVGAGSIFNTSKGISVAVVVQIIGMVMTDCLGITLVVAMAIFALKKDGNARKTGMAFWLLFSSIIAILISAPLGHLAGWCIDIGIKSIPGSGVLLNAINIKPTAFQDGLVASHSHLIAAALLCGLAALTAIYLQYESRGPWRKRMGILGLGMTLIALLLATVIYVFSAIAGWEPPTIFASGPNGIPLDDLVLTTGEIGILLLMAGLSGSPGRRDTKSFTPIKAAIRIAIFLVWVLGFVGTVLLGIYIELHEGFYGAGVSPAPGALNDNIFIRAHLLYSFFLLPIILAVLLAVGCKYNHATAPGPWPRLFVWTSVFGMASGLAGEILWFVTRGDKVFVAGMSIMGVALIAGMVSLWPYATVEIPGRNL